jgi:hypothetical protein
MFLVGFPLLVVPFALYNMIAFLMPGVSWTGDLVTVGLMSGTGWVLTPGDLLVAASLLLLFGELLKSTRMSARSIVDHLLAAVLFIAMAAEFLLVRQAATGTFFLLTVIGFVDAAGGVVIRVRSPRRPKVAEASLQAEPPGKVAPAEPAEQAEQVEKAL